MLPVPSDHELSHLLCDGSGHCTQAVPLSSCQVPRVAQDGSPCPGQGLSTGPGWASGPRACEPLVGGSPWREVTCGPMKLSVPWTSHYHPHASGMGLMQGYVTLVRSKWLH